MTHPTISTQQSLLPNSQQFEDTTRTLGVESRGFHFTGMTTDNEGHDAAIHTSRSLLYDNRDDTENFVQARNGSRANQAFKDALGPITFGAPDPGVEFTNSTAEPSERGHGGTGPSWWDRIQTNFRGASTQSTNAGVKPPEKYEVGLRSSNVQVTAQPTSNNPGPPGTGSNNAPNQFSKNAFQGNGQ